MEISEVFKWLNVCQILLVFLLFLKSLPVKTGTMGISYPKFSFYISAFNQTEVTKNRFITYLPENINNQIKNVKQCFYKMLKIRQWLMIPKICEINKMTSSISQLNRTIVFYNERTINYKHTRKDFDIMWFTGEGNGKTSVLLPWEPLNSMKMQKDRTLKDEFLRSVCAQYATGDQRRNNSRKNEEMETKQKQYPHGDVTGDGSKVWCCKEQYCIVTWNVRLWIKANWKWSIGDGKSKHRHFRNQWPKMDWNGWI